MPINFNNNNQLASRSITKEGASFKHQKVIATGGTITEVGEWRIHTFTGSSTFTLTSFIGSDIGTLYIDYLIVGGGGGAGYTDGGGGGGGGVVDGFRNLPPGNHAIVVGGGAASSSSISLKGVNGSDSSFYSVTAPGGGGGGSPSNYNGATGGSGGGGAASNISASIGGFGVSLKGFPGGNAPISAVRAGGGGGAEGTGGFGDNYATTEATPGGDSRIVRINGHSHKYGGSGWAAPFGPVTPTGTDDSNIYLGYYGYGANAPDVASEVSPDGNPGIVIIRYKYR